MGPAKHSEPKVSAALINALAAERSRFNAQIAEMCHRDARFDVAALTAFIHTGLDAVARAVDEVAPHATISVVRDAFDIALTLTAQGLVGPQSRTPFVERAWCDVTPVCPRLVAEQPREVLGMLSNAAVHIASMPSAHPQRWIDEVQLLAPRAATVVQLRLIGQVAAWRAGLPHFRESAVHAAAQLPAELALVATGGRPSAFPDAAAAEQEWTRVKRALLASPWWTHKDERLPVHREGMEVGAFTGFGGSFPEPPLVCASVDGFLVRSADRFHLLVTDAHGAALLAAQLEEFEQAARSSSAQSGANAARQQGTRLRLGQRGIELGWPDHGLTIAENEHTVVVTSTYSHAMRVIAKA